jgi:hypothetical protein
MANVKITDMTAASTPLAGTELLEIVQSGVSVKAAAADIAASATNVRTVATGGTGASTLTGYVKGSGTSAMTASATIPFNDLAGRAWINASSSLDQTGSTSAATALTMNTGTTGTGINVNASSQITFTDAGTYMVSHSTQFANSAASDHTATIWLRKNGTNIANSASVITIPKVADGGSADHSTVWFETVTAGQYIEVMFLVSNTAVTADATVAGAIAPAIPSIAVSAMRIA